MKILTAAQMREVDRRTMEAGIPGIVLMENAGHRVVEFLEEHFRPLESQRIVVFCGKGNNGGDGLVIARQLHTRFRPKSLHVLLTDPSIDHTMLNVVGLSVDFEIAPTLRAATLIVDALLGTGLAGPARGRAAEWIHEINTGFPSARVVAVDIPSGMASDTVGGSDEFVRADATVTFTAPKPCHVLWDSCGEVRVASIGSPAHLWENDPEVFLSVIEPGDFRSLFQPRARESNKGAFGHALIVAGGPGKTGAAAMSGIAALRAGAGLVTVASSPAALDGIAAHAAELMTEPIDGNVPPSLLERKNVVALGPGMGNAPGTVSMIRNLVDNLELPAVVDADGLNALADYRFQPKGQRVFTPHPGEMARLSGLSVAAVQSDRIGLARSYARDHGIYLLLKGNRTVVAFPDGRVWINPTGSPAMATGGTGDVLTGMLAGLIAQFPEKLETAILAGVYLHGRAGELGAVEFGDKGLMATDLFRFLPEAIREIHDISNRF